MRIMMQDLGGLGQTEQSGGLTARIRALMAKRPPTRTKKPATRGKAAPKKDAPKKDAPTQAALAPAPFVGPPAPFATPGDPAFVGPPAPPAAADAPAASDRVVASSTETIFTRYKWHMAGGAALVLVGGYLLWRRRRA